MPFSFRTIVLKTGLPLLLLMTISLQSSAQDKSFLPDKPGTFTIKSQPLNGQGPDLYGKPCSITNAESTAALAELGKVIQLYRELPVLTDIKGFDAICDVGTGRWNSKFGYGVPSTVCFYLRTWSLSKGKETQWRVEPPQWRFEVNMTEKFCSGGFNVSNFSDAYNPSNPAFSPELADRTTVALRELFMLPGVKEEVSRGIDRYGDYVVLFNPDRPPYWEQVTVREVFRLLLDYWKHVPDKAQTDAMVPILTSEFNRFSEAEKDGYAYFGSPESISRIGAVKNNTPVMRPNPGYWDRSLPRSAIQFMMMEIPDEEVLESKMESALKRGDGYYYIYRLLSETDLSVLTTVIWHP